jgi:hypothetical protein
MGLVLTAAIARSRMCPMRMVVQIMSITAVMTAGVVGKVTATMVYFWDLQAIHVFH